jgi:hypothetical protein
MKDQAVSGATEQSAAKENQGAQGSGLTIGEETTSALKFSQQVEQQQDAAEGRFGGEELLQAKVVCGQIVFQFRDAVFHIRSAVAQG